MPVELKDARVLVLHLRHLERAKTSHASPPSMFDGFKMTGLFCKPGPEAIQVQSAAIAPRGVKARSAFRSDAPARDGILKVSGRRALSLVNGARAPPAWPARRAWGPVRATLGWFWRS